MKDGQMTRVEIQPCVMVDGCVEPAGEDKPEFWGVYKRVWSEEDRRAFAVHVKDFDTFEEAWVAASALAALRGLKEVRVTT